MTQEELDAQCAKWGHGARKPVHCANPQCPGVELTVEDATDEFASAPDVTDELENVEHAEG